MSDTIRYLDAGSIAAQLLWSDGMTEAERQELTVLPSVAPSTIQSMVTANKLHDHSYGMVDEAEVREIFANTRVIHPAQHNIVRVSIGGPTASGACDPILNPENEWTSRTIKGWDFANLEHLTEDERWAGVLGVWPIREEDAAMAMLTEAWLLPCIKGFVDNTLIQKIVGYRLDLTTKKRWFITRDPKTAELRELLGDERRHGWLNVGRGPVAEAMFRTEDVAAFSDHVEADDVLDAGDSAGSDIEDEDEGDDTDQ